MTDRDFERRLRAGLRQLVGEGASPTLRASVIAIPDVVTPTPQRRFAARWQFPRMSHFAPIAIAATAVAVAILVGVGLILRSPNVGPSPLPDPTQNAALAWSLTGSMVAPRSHHTATLLLDGTVLVVGGAGGDGNNRASAELYDSATGSWTATGSMLTYAQNVSLTVLLDGRVLATGGHAPTGTFSELFDPVAGSWAATGNMVTARDGFTATLLPDGKVLVAGGEHDGVLASAELFDPATESWTATRPMSTPRQHHVASLLPDGKVLVAGGSTWEDGMASAELYDPASETWTPTGTMLTKYNTESATQLADGKVLVAGFVGCAFGAEGPCSFVSVAELYDPNSGAWTATEPTRVVREGFTATLLPDGKVLIAGGSEVVSGSYNDLDTASAELYDPVTGSWTATAGMVVARKFHTATRLSDGRVLVAGGSSGYWLAPPVASAESYSPGTGR